MNGLVLFGSIAAFLLICVAIGLIRGMVKSQIRCITVVVAAVVAFVLTAILKSGLLDRYTVEGIMIGLGLSDGSTGNLMASTAFAETAIGLFSALLMPLVFVTVFAIISIGAWIVYAIATTFLRRRIRNANARAEHRFLKAWVCSLIGGLVVVFVMLVPINVYTTVGATFLDVAEEAELLEESEATALKEAVVPVKDSFVMQTFRVLGGDLVTDAFVNFEVNGVATGLYEETETFGGVACRTVAYVNSESASAEDLIRYYVDSIEKSETLAYAFGEVIYYATDAWSKGEAFVGIERPESGELFDELVSDLLLVLKKDARDAENLREDLVTLADLLVILEEHDLLDRFADDAALTDSVGSNGAVKALTDKLSENERMMPLVKTINRVGMRAIATSLDLSGVGRAEYDPLLGDIADTLNATAHVSRNARLSLVENELERAFADAEVEIDREVVSVYAEMLVDEFGTIDTLTADDIAEYLQSHSV